MCCLNQSGLERQRYIIDVCMFSLCQVLVAWQ